ERPQACCELHAEVAYRAGVEVAGVGEGEARRAVVLAQRAECEVHLQVVEVVARLAGLWFGRCVTVGGVNAQVDGPTDGGRGAEVGGGVVDGLVGDPVGQHGEVVDVPDGGLELHVAAPPQVEGGVDGAGVTLGEVIGVAHGERHPVDV